MMVVVGWTNGRSNTRRRVPTNAKRHRVPTQTMDKGTNALLLLLLLVRVVESLPNTHSRFGSLDTV